MHKGAEMSFIVACSMEPGDPGSTNTCRLFNLSIPSRLNEGLTNTPVFPEVPFLPVRDDFHPKRNQARQKLATLPKTKFKDLSGDVFHELGRRYPEFKEPEVRASYMCICSL